MHTKVLCCMWLKFSNPAIAMRQEALVLFLLSIQDLEFAGRLD